MRTLFSRFALGAAGFVMLAGTSVAGEKSFMHCFYFSPVKEATQADWDTFYKATDALPGKIPGVKRVMYGKLARPMMQLGATVDAEGRKKLAAGEKMQAEVSGNVREYGVCMEMENEAALKTYATHPGHTEWNKAYEKVRKAGTLTVDFMGQ